MPVYRNADVLYTCLRTTFDRIERESPEALKGLTASRLSLRLKCSAPAAEILLNGRQRPFRTAYGPTPLRPDLDIQLGASTRSSDSHGRPASPRRRVSQRSLEEAGYGFS